MDFKARTATLDGFDGLLVSVDGELDIATVRTLAEAAELAVSVSCPLVLDLSECSFIDSMSPHFVLHTQQALAEVGEAMALVTRPCPDTKDVVPNRYRSERSHLQSAKRGNRVGRKPKGEGAGGRGTFPQSLS